MPRRREHLPRLAAADPTDLGVHRGPGPYVERAVDGALATAVGAAVGAGPDAPAGAVLATGPRLAGTTRALARAARLVLGDHRVLRADPADAAALRAARARAAGVTAGRPVVLWVDDAAPGLLVDPDTADALAGSGDPAAGAGVPVLLTAREERLHPDLAPDLAARGPRPLRVPGPLDAAEVAAATARGRRGAEGEVLGRRVVDVAAARAVLRPGADPDPGAVRTAAVLRAAADWDRLGVPGALGRSALAELAVAYAAALDPRGRHHGRDHLLAAVDALAGRRAGWLRRRRRGDALHHGVDPRLSVAADDLVATAAGWDSPAALDAHLDAAVTAPALRRAVGVLALHRRLDGAALTLLADVDPGAVGAGTAYGVGLAALERDDDPEARRWFTGLASAADATEPAPGAVADYRPRAAFWLGLDPAAPRAERRAHLALVVAEGTDRDAADAAHLLSALATEDGDDDAAAAWERRAGVDPVGDGGPADRAVPRQRRDEPEVRPRVDA